MKKRCLVWMLLLALLLPILGMEASAEKVTESTERHYGIAFYSNGVCSICGKIGTCGSDLTWNFDDKTGTLTVSGKGKIKNYGDESYNRAPWHDLIITKLVVEDGVYGIGDYAFYDSTIKTAKLPEGLMSIGENAFCSSYRLQECNIPNSVTSIGYRAFAYTDLREVNISANVTSAGAYVFEECDNLRKATIDCARTFDDMFWYCDNLKEVILTDNVKIIGAGTFRECPPPAEATFSRTLGPVLTTMTLSCGRWQTASPMAWAKVCSPPMPPAPAARSLHSCIAQWHNLPPIPKVPVPIRDRYFYPTMD